MKRRTKQVTGTGHHPAADALDWDEAIKLIVRLERDLRFRDAMLVASGCFLGLRISDLLPLRWKDLLAEDVTVTEKKTGKKRRMRINAELRRHAELCFRELEIEDAGECILRSSACEDPHPITRQRAAQLLRGMKETYHIRSAKVFSTHSLRKTFGRRVWQQECDRGRGEQALLLLCDVFGHSNVSITKRYLGIRQEEILSVYDALTD